MTTTVFRPYAVTVEFSSIKVSDPEVAIRFTAMLADELHAAGIHPLGVSVLDNPLSLVVFFKEQASAEALAEDFSATLDYMKQWGVNGPAN